MIRRLQEIAYFVAFVVGFCCATIVLLIEMLIELLVTTDKKDSENMKTPQLPPVDFSWENLKRNRKYAVALRNDSREVVCYFDTMVRNGGKQMYCVFTEKRGGKGNVLIVALPYEIRTATEINSKGAETE